MVDQCFGAVKVYVILDSEENRESRALWVKGHVAWSKGGVVQPQQIFTPADPSGCRHTSLADLSFKINATLQVQPTITALTVKLF